MREKCDECGGEITNKKVPYELYGVKLGDFPAEVCNKCGEIVFTEETSREMTDIARKQGLWGLETKTKVGKVGDSLDVRIPKKIADFLGLKKGRDVFVHPQKNKIIIDVM